MKSTSLLTPSKWCLHCFRLFAVSGSQGTRRGFPASSSLGHPRGKEIYCQSPAAAQSVICVYIFCTYLIRVNRPFTQHIVFCGRSPPYRYRLPMADIFESAFELFKAGLFGAVFPADSYRFASALVLLDALRRYTRPDCHSYRRIHLYMCLIRLQSHLAHLYMLMRGERRSMAKAIPSCNKGTFAHLPTGRLYSSSYLYIASIDLLQWMPGVYRLGLRGRLVYLGLFLARRIHICVDALTHCNISRRIRICSVIALQNGQP